MREVRRALLEADVSLDVVRSFIDRVREQAIGATVVKSVTPGQMVVKIVHDELVATLGSDGQTIDLNAVPPVAIMMVGLQGSGKTTTTAKLARRMTQRDKRKVLMASLDIYRPAAMEQLAVLGRDLDIPTLPLVDGQKPQQIAKRALEAGKLGGYDVRVLDTPARPPLPAARGAGRGGGGGPRWWGAGGGREKPKKGCAPRAKRPMRWKIFIRRV